LLIDIGRQQQLKWIITEHGAIGKFHDREAIVEDFEGGFLPSPIDEMAEHEHRLSLPLDSKIAQRVLGGCRTGKLTARAGADDRHSKAQNDRETIGSLSMYHRVKNCVKRQARR